MKNKKIYFIAEIGRNYDGDIEKAKKMIKDAADAGADAVKFQSFNENSFYTKPMKDLKKLSLSWGDHVTLSKTAKKCKVSFVSTPACVKTAKWLNKLNVPFFKIASMDIDNIPLLEYICSTKRPVVLSTGLANFDLIKVALWYLKNNSVTLLHCISYYPPQDNELDLGRLLDLGVNFGLPIGFSDHTPNILSSLAAVTLNAIIVEKHFTYESSDKSWGDHAVSIKPSEFKEMVEKSDQIVSMFEKSSPEKREKTEFLLRRKIVASKDIKKKEKITEKNIELKRSYGQIFSKWYPTIIGHKASMSYKKGEALKWQDLQLE